MYEFFRLTGDPFSVAADPRFIYMSPIHRHAAAHLDYGLRLGAGFVLLTGEIGAGKSTVARLFLRGLGPTDDVALVVNPRLDCRSLLLRICEDLGVALPADSADLIDAIHGHLLLAHAQGRRTLIVIDEAQALSLDVLEQLRLLTNLDSSGGKLQVMLIGQPELRTMLRSRELEPLAQRVVARFHISALPESETPMYIAHRLSVVGFSGPLPFERRALQLIHRVCDGVPRRINVLCNRALHIAASAGQDTITRDIVIQAAIEAFDEPSPAMPERESVDGMSEIRVVAVPAPFHSPAIASVPREPEKRLTAEPPVDITQPAESEAEPTTAAAPAAAAPLAPEPAISTPPGTPPSPSGIGRWALLAACAAGVALFILWHRVPPAAGVSVAASVPVASAEPAAAPGAPTPLASESIAPVPTQSSPSTSPPSHEPAPANPAGAKAKDEPVAASSAAIRPATSIDDLPLTDLDALFAAAPHEEGSSWRALARLWDVKLGPGEPCAAALTAGLHCYRTTGGLAVIRQIDRPGVLRLETRDGRFAYAIITALTGTRAAFGTGPNRQIVPLAALAGQWHGDYATLWKAPPGYHYQEGLSLDDEAATWLAQQLSAIEGSASLETDDLPARLAAFQLAHGLTPDSRLGPLTVMQLDLVGAHPVPRLRDAD